MLVVRCPQVTTGRGERLVSERRITGLAAVLDGWLLTVDCPCGQQHTVAVRRTPLLPGPVGTASAA